jgi:hypothetical protein
MDDANSNKVKTLFRLSGTEGDVVELLRIPVVDWVSLADAVAHIEMAADCDRLTAIQRLRAAIADSSLRVRWMDQENEYDVPPSDRAFWTKVSIRLDQGGEVLHHAVDLMFVAYPKSSAIERKEAPPRYRGLLVDRRALHDAWPMPPDVEQPETTASCVPLPPVGKPAIRAKVRELYASRPSVPPNMWEAEMLIKKSLPRAARDRIREVLKEPEFARQRRATGKRGKRKG